MTVISAGLQMIADQIVGERRDTQSGHGGDDEGCPVIGFETALWANGQDPVTVRHLPGFHALHQRLVRDEFLGVSGEPGFHIGAGLATNLPYRGPTRFDTRFESRSCADPDGAIELLQSDPRSGRCSWSGSAVADKGNAMSARTAAKCVGPNVRGAATRRPSSALAGRMVSRAVSISALALAA